MNRNYFDGPAGRRLRLSRTPPMDWLPMPTGIEYRWLEYVARSTATLLRRHNDPEHEVGDELRAWKEAGDHE